MTLDRAEEGGRHSEMIQTATTTYTLIKGKWVSIPYDGQERVKDMKESGEEQERLPKRRPRKHRRSAN